MTATPALDYFDDILDFLASSPSAEQIVAYHPPDHLDARLATLLELNRDNKLTAEQRNELDEFLRMNRLMRRLKARAKLASF